jgi:hypothetical protein
VFYAVLKSCEIRADDSTANVGGRESSDVVIGQKDVARMFLDSADSESTTVRG